MLTLLVGGAMVLSGCWGLVVGPDESGRKALVVSEGFTRQIVYTHCGLRNTITVAVAECTLNSIARLCRDHPLKNMKPFDCVELTAYPISSTLVREMQHAIAELVLVFDKCLVGYFGAGRAADWTASPRVFACG